VALYSTGGATLSRMAISDNAFALFNGILNPIISIPATPVIAGNMYAVACVFVGTAAPTVYGCYPSFNQTLISPEVSGSILLDVPPLSVLKSALTNDAAYRMQITS